MPTYETNKDNELHPATLRPTVMEVELGALTKNYQTVQQRVGKSLVMPIIKANAYGHGLVEVARHLENCGAPYFGVAFVEEGIQLRQAGIKSKILVLGGLVGTQVKYFLDYDLDITASSISKLEKIEETAAQMGKRARVHLKIDTGLERLGVHYYNAEKILEFSLNCKHCDIVGVFSHFACAGDEDNSFTKLQLERFLEVLSFYDKRSLPVPLRHIANSAAVMSFAESYLDMVRSGIAIYGVYPASHLVTSMSLTPAMKLRSQVVYFKVVKEGAGVSYGHTWRAPKDSRVVTIPIGYGDGYFRALSNKGIVLIRGKRYPVVGTVCMDQIMVNIGDGEAYNGDEVVLIGAQGSEQISVREIATLLNTNTHEVLVATNLRVPRKYLLNGRPVS
jgi:alanine racemase